MGSSLPIFEAANLLTMRGKAGIIGRGGYGQIRLCQNLQSKKFVVKYFTLTGTQEQMDEKLKKIKTEGEILHKLSHPNILKVFGFTEWKEYVGIVTEYMPGGNLDGFLNNKKLLDIPWVIRLRMAVEIGEAIRYLHLYKPKKELIHGDIKPDNVLLDNNLNAKLADFGSVNMAQHTGASITSTQVPMNKQHTLFYTAPEFLKEPTKPRTAKMDVYSFGIVLYEFVTKSRPYENASVHLHIILDAIVHREQRPDQSHFDEIQSELSSDDLSIFKLLVDQMKKCWSQQASDRPKIQRVCNYLRMTFDEIDDKTIDEQIRNVIKILGRNEMEIDTKQAVSLSSISSDSDDVTQIHSLPATTKNTQSISDAVVSKVTKQSVPQLDLSSMPTTVHKDLSVGLPVGWEARVDHLGRVYYADYNTGTSTLERPRFEERNKDATMMRHNLNASSKQRPTQQDGKSIAEENSKHGNIEIGLQVENLNRVSLLEDETASSSSVSITTDRTPSLSTRRSHVIAPNTSKVSSSMQSMTLDNLSVDLPGKREERSNVGEQNLTNQKKQNLLQKTKNSPRLYITTQQTNEKKQRQKQEILEQIKKNPRKEDLVEICREVMELADDDFTSEVASHFPTNAWFNGTPLSFKDVRAISFVMKKLNKKIESLNLRWCQLASDKFQIIVEGFEEMRGSVDWLCINSNHLSSDDVSGICEMMERVNVKLEMWGCFDDGEGLWRDGNQTEIKIIQDKLDSMRHSNLEVYVDWGKYLRKNARN